ncbi:RNA pseudouridine synthase [Bacterioplanes sanyensis]|uniref:RNA pseudouridine synthase n=2 Tax=Bacterioplanes sanyensis TaxID=1249553 RepID=A0A222FQ90_9GAMM|nr:RNA pseudouridine synthase [Bacterioplanes sanyensis]
MHNEDGEGFIAALSQHWQQPLWPLHRLDKVTSGILLLGTSADAARRFGHLFEQHQIEKYYLAQSQHKPKKKQGWIKGDMVKARNGSWKLSRSLDNPAVTRFISHYDAEQQRRLFLLQPHTGRTHQLRVAMKSLAAPIDGDQRYGGDVAERTFLHAMAMRFVDRGEEVCLFNKPEGNHWGHLPPAWQAPWQCF